MTSYGADGDPEGLPNRSALFNNSSVSQENMTGLLSNDRTHVLKFSGSYDFPTGLTTGISFIAQSGTPLSIYDGGRKWGLNFLEPRGSQGRTPASWDLSARFTYNVVVFADWNSKLILDVFHIGNPQKAVYIDQRRSLFVQGTVPNPNYGQVKLYQPSMSLRLGMEVSF